MEIVVFYILAAIIIVFSIMAVTTQRILRSATYLLFVLFGTAGVYFQLNYSFLGAVQLTIYAGGIIVLYVFSILLTSPDGDKIAGKLPKSKLFAGLVASVAGAALCIFITLSHTFPSSRFTPGEIDMKTIGFALLGTEKYQYMLPFEAISVLLLACIIGGIMIARKRG
ncbi:NADH-quinone oxidoreductase subunit J [uncultured Odoribacter sp.]|uniref:NADH-quinone oxidoreductase subunit J family protein n=1 Tax=uncultured Odoribacter sp. TaxID=876416 RepID=UPI0026179255|nr:NADH-quinone oxidoreductase subunit J [uncultured Odoribacter sp.]